jgi:KDO2-lipid IV(A) lauroyltransferase
MQSSPTSLVRFAHPRHWPTWCAVVAQRVLITLPLPVLWLLGRGLGRLMLALGGGRKRVAERNIEACFPELSPEERAQLVSEHFGALGVALLTMPLAWWASARRLDRLVRVIGREHYDRARAQGRSVIFLSPHFVTLELTGAVVSRITPMMIMYQRMKNPLLDAVVARGRQRFGSKTVERSSNLKGVIRRLRQGEPLGYLPDQNPGPRRGIFVPFFGIPTATHPALGRIAAMSDAVVIFCIGRQLPRGRGFEVELMPPLEGFPSGDAEADTAHMNRAIEKYVRERPAEYFWVHKRFKVRPAGEPEFY